MDSRAAIGIGLGLALGFSPLLRRYSLASFEVLRPLPAIAFLPLALLLFNFSLTTELVLMIYASVWPVLINTMGGVMSVHRGSMTSAARCASRACGLCEVIIPAAAPAIVIGCRLSMGLTLVMAIIAEMIANPHGLGYAVISELQAMQPQRMFAYVLFIGLLSIALNAGLLWVSRQSCAAIAGRTRIMRRGQAINLQLVAALQYARGLLPLLLGLAIWQTFGPEKSPYFPPPSAWFDSIVFLARNGKLWPALAATVATFAPVPRLRARSDFRLAS